MSRTRCKSGLFVCDGELLAIPSSTVQVWRLACWRGLSVSAAALRSWPRVPCALTSLTRAPTMALYVYFACRMSPSYTILGRCLARAFDASPAVRFTCAMIIAPALSRRCPSCMCISAASSEPSAATSRLQSRRDSIQTMQYFKNSPHMR